MASLVKLRIILGENNSQRLILPDGIPESVEELAQQIKRQCGIDGALRLQFMDVEFGNEFTNLLSMLDVQDKGTIKVIFISEAPPPPPHLQMSPHPFHLGAPLIQTYFQSPPPLGRLHGLYSSRFPGSPMMLSYSWTEPTLLSKQPELC